MSIQFYISDQFSIYYLPFLLYRESITNILENKYKKKVNYIYNFDDLKNDNNIVILSYIYSLDETKIDYLKNFNQKIFLINTEYYKNLNMINIIKKINNENLKFYILEYNILNINHYKENYKNIKWVFIPLCYNIYLEHYYNLQISNKISYKNKDIDIFFYGSINDRRKKIIDILKKKYNVITVSGLSGLLENKQICNLIERSKIVLNISYHDSNVIFDYYRNSLLLANKVLLVSESIIHKNYEIEKELIELEENMITTSYDNITNIIDKYINVKEDEYNDIINKQYESFKKYDMTNKIIDLFNKILNISKDINH